MLLNSISVFFCWKTYTTANTINYISILFLFCVTKRGNKKLKRERSSARARIRFYAINSCSSRVSDRHVETLPHLCRDHIMTCDKYDVELLLLSGCSWLAINWELCSKRYRWPLPSKISDNYVVIKLKKKFDS